MIFGSVKVKYAWYGKLMAWNVVGELTVISYKFGELKYAKSVLCFLTKVLAEMIELALQFNLFDITSIY